MSRLIRISLLLFVICSLSGCQDPWSPPSGTTAFEPPPIYAEWWADVEACSHLSGDLLGVTWFRVAADSTWLSERAGEWRARRIYLAEWIVKATTDPEFTRRPIADTWFPEYMVRHEILHDLLGGDPEHASSTWNRCVLNVV